VGEQKAIKRGLLEIPMKQAALMITYLR
jgi:hypothetical protein